MRWFKNWLGLKLFVACWILVLLIPSWRQDAREQWQSEKWNYESFARGLTREKIEKIADVAPNDFAAQLELLTTPGSFNSFDKSAHNDNLFAAYLALSDRFPRENEIRKSLLVNITRGGWNIEPASFYANLPVSQRPNSAKENWLSQMQLESALVAAREGAKIEPRNSFFPWMECALSFALKRPSKAMTALERASKCTNFDDGTLQTARRRIALMRRVQSVTWSDKASVMWSLLLPHFAKIRASARAALEFSRQAHQRGEKVRALQIAASVARAGATISDASQNSLITVFLGDSIQHEAWHNALAVAGREGLEMISPDYEFDLNPGGSRGAMKKWQRELAQRNADYAREIGQDAIARQVLSTLPHLKSARLGAAYYAPEFDGFLQCSKKPSQAFWLQSWLLRLSFIAALLWIVALFFTFKSAFDSDTKRLMVSWAAFCVGATVVFLGVAVIYFGLGSTEKGFFFNPRVFPPLYTDYYADNLDTFLALLWITPIVLTALLKVVKRPQWKLEAHSMRPLYFLQMLIYALIITSLTAVFWLYSNRFTPLRKEESYNTAILISLFSIVAIGGLHIVTARGKRRLAALLFWCVPLILLAARTMLHPVHEASSIVMLLGLGLFCLIASARLANWRPASQVREFFFDLMRRVRILAATLAVASALFYLGVKIAALPAEVKMNALLDAQLQIGEVAWLENQLKLRK